jgi:hypothetical protein
MTREPHGKYETARTDTLPNPERGCGHLDRGAAYIRGLTETTSGGVLPSFVRLSDPLPYREIGTGGGFTRGYELIDGITMQVAIANDDDAPDFVPLSTDGFDKAPYNLARAGNKLIDAGVYESAPHIPESETQRHLDRVAHRGCENGDDWGGIPTCGQQDLLMRAGETYYDTPDEFITECVRHGLSKKIPIGPNNVPAIVPGVTRCWVMHPNATDDDSYGGGIIGYAYIDKPVFTEPADGELPSYVEDMVETGDLWVADIEEPEVEDESTPDATIADFGDDADEQPGIEVREGDDGPWCAVENGDRELAVNGKENAQEVADLWRDSGYEQAAQHENAHE